MGKRRNITRSQQRPTTLCTTQPSKTRPHRVTGSHQFVMQPDGYMTGWTHTKQGGHHETRNRPFPAMPGRLTLSLAAGQRASCATPRSTSGSIAMSLSIAILLFASASLIDERNQVDQPTAKSCSGWCRCPACLESTALPVACHRPVRDEPVATTGV